ncbi:hypothetical protein CCHR01_14887 [Colletotrichum chrysophilum]|uniref:Uncharacterized protein n=1 Tax=Colletotrichum chrysophilum TaxID=1836956 RepID=A0AAD9E974_9PEZI|nr:hypothetical protein CCHR01_14887 [Colletotrichum chrysophilum]
MRMPLGVECYRSCVSRRRGEKTRPGSAYSSERRSQPTSDELKIKPRQPFRPAVTSDGTPREKCVSCP